MYQRRPFWPGKFGFLRVKTNEESSAKVMNRPPATARPNSCCVESEKSTTGT